MAPTQRIAPTEPSDIDETSPLCDPNGYLPKLRNVPDRIFLAPVHRIARPDTSDTDEALSLCSDVHFGARGRLTPQHAKDPSRAPKATPGTLRSSLRSPASLAQALSRSQVRIYRPCAVQTGIPRSCEPSRIDDLSSLCNELHLPKSPTSTKHRPCAIQMGISRSCETYRIDDFSPLCSGLHVPTRPTPTKHRPCAAMCTSERGGA